MARGSEEKREGNLLFNQANPILYTRKPLVNYQRLSATSESRVSK